MTARTPGQDPVPAPSAAGSDRAAAMTAAVLDGSVLTPGTPLRTAVFDAVRADREGPVTHELIGLTGHHRPAVRRTALTLLTELAFNGPPSWQGPIEAAAARLHDPDPDARRAAVRLLVRAGGTDLARTALDTHTDPATRIALADALLFHLPHTPCPPGPLRTDPLPDIRLAACIAALRAAPEEEWAALDAQAVAEPAALSDRDADRARTLGSRWGDALSRQGRERHCYAAANSASSPRSAGSAPPRRPRCHCSNGSPGNPGSAPATGRSPSPGSPASVTSSSPRCAPRRGCGGMCPIAPLSSSGCSTTAA
ncbi:hypothetical protein [Streptomyces sp. C10]|uniref:hypothetical protein n=1 Tax=Streptomyces sp. C10 TaxID=531941 RepID=UPI0039809CFC